MNFHQDQFPLLVGYPRALFCVQFYSPCICSLFFIFESHKVSCHIYADDTQLYFPLNSGSDSVSSLLACLEDIKNWMENNFLQLNKKKTEVMLFGHFHLLPNLSPTLGPFEDNICEKVKNLCYF